jgi:hypothetical protein
LIQAKALTSRAVGRANVILTPVGICQPYEENDPALPSVRNDQFNAIWDTGATNSAITPQVVVAAGLKPSGQIVVNTAGGDVTTNTYIVHLLLPMDVVIPNLTVTGAPLAGADALIGMDIIGLGDFSITHQEGKTVMSFRIPSMVEHDFVPEADRYNAKIIRREAKENVGQRVQPKKYRKG